MFTANKRFPFTKRIGEKSGGSVFFGGTLDHATTALIVAVCLVFPVGGESTGTEQRKYAERGSSGGC